MNQARRRDQRRVIPILLLLVPATAFSFAAFVLPSARAAHSQPSITTTSSSFSSSSCDRGVDASYNNDAASSSSSMPKTNAPPSSSSSSMPVWFQHEMSITAPSRGCHLITSQVNRIIKDDLSKINIGMANLFIMHTSASLTINENADPDVCR
jgi:hypothetical protein